MRESNLAKLVAMNGAILIVCVIIAGLLGSALERANKDNIRLQAELKEQQCTSFHSSLH